MPEISDDQALGLISVRIPKENTRLYKRVHRILRSRCISVVPGLWYFKWSQISDLQVRIGQAIEETGQRMTLIFHPIDKNRCPGGCLPKLTERQDLAEKRSAKFKVADQVRMNDGLVGAVKRVIQDGREYEVKVPRDRTRYFCQEWSLKKAKRQSR